MARLYANENFPFPVVEALRRLGDDVLTSQETGLSGRGAPDEEVLEFARQDNRALLTLNRKHFFRLHSLRPSHAGIIACTFDPDFDRQARRIHSAIESRVLSGQFLRVSRPGPGE
jgi:hypothetical protein